MFLVVCCRRMTSSGEEFGGRVNNSVVVGLAKHVSHVHFGVDIFFSLFYLLILIDYGLANREVATLVG